MKMAPKFKFESIKLVAGLGNLGEPYARTYHNAGRLVVAELANVPEKDFKSSKDYLSYRGANHTFIIPRTFMNASGPAIKSALHAFRAKPLELLVVHDDADLALGTTRLHYGRGSAGHRGVESVIAAIGTKNFWRLRIGVRPSPRRSTSEGGPPHQKVNAGDFVLKPMPREARDIIIAAVERFRDRFFVATGGGDVTLRTRE